MTLCNEPTDVHGAFGCPREAGHGGEHYWWIPFELAGYWRVIVYWGPPAQRHYVCRGAFIDAPEGGDVGTLLLTIAELNRRAERRRTELVNCPAPAPLPPPAPRPRRKKPSGPSLAERALRAAARQGEALRG